jgi:transcriptional regulator with XRE-family HTH domain
MVRPTGVRELRRRQRWLRASIGRQLADAREEASLPRVAVAAAAGIDPSHLLRIEAGAAAASLEAIVAVADVLGSDVSVRLFPARPARIVDRLQAPIVEALIRGVGRGWRPEVEVVVLEPVRGVVDIVLAARQGSVAIAVEVHSELRSIERVVRRLAEKAEGVAALGRFGPDVSRLLVIRSTTETRAIARLYSATLQAAFPAQASDAHRALFGTSDAWPGPAVIWADLTGSNARILDRAPRSVVPKGAATAR